MRTIVKLVLCAVTLGALVVLLAGPVGAQQYPPSEGAPTAPAGGSTGVAAGTSTGAASGTSTSGLPRTGSNDTVPLIWIGLGAVAIGSVLAVGARRQRQVRSRRVDI
jgi:LPXTG-motif cell wall-anchored protein